MYRVPRAATAAAGLGLLLAVLAGCRPPGNPPPTPAPAAEPPKAATNAAAADDDGPVYHLDRALTGLPRVKLMIGTADVTAEVCVSLPQIATGLMHRAGIGPEESMLFVFGTPQRRSFYMKNVTFPIAAAYIDPEGVVQEVVQLKAMDRTPVPSKSEKIQYVLETAPDWFQRHGIAPGTLVVTDRGPLSEKLGPFAILK